MSEPLSGSGTAAALGGATVFGLFTGTDFGIVFGAFAGALFVATMPQALSAWRIVGHFVVSFIIGVLGAKVLASYLADKAGYDSASIDALVRGAGVGGVSEDSVFHSPAGYWFSDIRAVLPSAGRRRQCQVTFPDC